MQCSVDAAPPTEVETARQAAERLSVSRGAVLAWIRERRLEPVSGRGKPGDPYICRRVDIDRLAKTIRTRRRYASALVAPPRFETANEAALRNAVSIQRILRLRRQGRLTAERGGAGNDPYLFLPEKVDSALALAADWKKQTWQRIDAGDGLETTRQAAARRGVTSSAVSDWVQKGLLKPVVRGAMRNGPSVFRPEDVDRAAEAARQRLLAIRQRNGRKHFKNFKPHAMSAEAARAAKEARRLAKGREELLTVPEVERRYGINRYTIYHAVSTERLKPAAKDPVQFAPATIEKWLGEPIPTDWIAIVDIQAKAPIGTRLDQTYKAIQGLKIRSRQFRGKDSRGRQKNLFCVPKVQEAHILEALGVTAPVAAKATPVAAVPPATEPAVAKPNPNDDRDAWLYDRIVTRAERMLVVMSAFKEACASNGWTKLDSWPAMTAAVDRFIKRKGLQKRAARSQQIPK